MDYVNLVKHELTSSEGEEFEIKIEDFPFGMDIDLKQEMNITDNDHGNNLFQCSHCGENFTKNTILKSIRDHTLVRSLFNANIVLKVLQHSLISYVIK